MAITTQADPAAGIAIVGCGPGSPDYLTRAAQRAIHNATLLVGSPKLLSAFASAQHKTIPVGSNIDGVLEAIDSRRASSRIAVLVSGDPGLCSLARPILERFGREACQVLPGISSVQLAFARLGLDWVDARIVSAHKSIPEVTPADLAPFAVLAFLAGHRLAQDWIARLADALEERRVLFVCEDLSMPQESIQRLTSADLRERQLSTRAIVLLVKEELL
jgi:precorrin-6y C5,15-methyltransferase (decarboxylating) CbiE subunit